LLTVAIIGAGPLGRRLALEGARGGCRVLLEDVMPATLHHAQEYMRLQLGPEALETVTFVSSIEDAVHDADLAIDCVPDELESKLEILWLLDRMAPPKTVIGTPTTRLSIADLAGCTYRADQCIAIAADARELAGGLTGEIVLRTTARTSAAAINLMREFWNCVGIEPRIEMEATQTAG
jgi:3-hydroxybutyryl-CoA dehydrogenase